jgi:hypothetical protein
MSREQLGLEAFERRLCAAVTGALEARDGPAVPLRLSARGEDLMFALIEIHRRHPELRSTSEEYRLLLEAEEGELARFLLAPAASRAQPPRLAPADRPYPAVAFTMGEDGVEVTDPAWPARLRVSAAQQRLLARADGVRSVAQLCHEPEAIDALQQLVGEGLLCPGR